MDVAADESKEPSPPEDDVVTSAVEAGGERGDDKVMGGVVIGDIVDEVYSSESDEEVSGGFACNWYNRN
jgi:hypothetical protein